MAVVQDEVEAKMAEVVAVDAVVTLVEVAAGVAATTGVAEGPRREVLWAHNLPTRSSRVEVEGAGAVVGRVGVGVGAGSVPVSGTKAVEQAKVVVEDIVEAGRSRSTHPQ